MLCSATGSNTNNCLVCAWSEQWTLARGVCPYPEHAMQLDNRAVLETKAMREVPLCTIEQLAQVPCASASLPERGKSEIGSVPFIQ